jgi:hypothetical protein
MLSQKSEEKSSNKSYYKLGVELQREMDNKNNGYSVMSNRVFSFYGNYSFLLTSEPYKRELIKRKMGEALLFLSYH